MGLKSRRTFIQIITVFFPFLPSFFFFFFFFFLYSGYTSLFAKFSIIFVHGYKAIRRIAYNHFRSQEQRAKQRDYACILLKVEGVIHAGPVILLVTLNKSRYRLYSGDILVLSPISSIRSFYFKCYKLR